MVSNIKYIMKKRTMAWWGGTFIDFLTAPFKNKYKYEINTFIF